MAATRRITLAPVRAINPDNLKQLLAFLGQFLPIILKLFIPLDTPKEALPVMKVYDNLEAELSQVFETSDFTPEESAQLSNFILAFVHEYRDYVGPPPPPATKAA